MEDRMAAPRAAWKGFLRVESVTCGVKAVGVVTETETIRFNILSRRTGNTVKVAYVDEETNEPVPAEDRSRATRPTRVISYRLNLTRSKP
jgi:DNA end-binding protein Ku